MFLFLSKMKGIGSHLDILNQIKRFAPLLLIVIIGIILFFSMKDDEFSTDDSINDATLTDAAGITLESELNDKTTEIEETELGDVKVIVDIKGEVKEPGVYELQEDDRIQTAIERAGGFTNKADEQQINLAQKVHDEMVIYIPKEGEIETPIQPVPSPSGSGGASSNTPDDLIEVNKATVDELTKLQGIGPAKAQAIIDYREEHGLFKQVEDLLEVNGIGEKTLENIREQLLVR